MYIYIYVYMYICIYACLYIYMCIYIYIYIYIYWGYMEIMGKKMETTILGYKGFRTFILNSGYAEVRTYTCLCVLRSSARVRKLCLDKRTCRFVSRKIPSAIIYASYTCVVYMRRTVALISSIGRIQCVLMRMPVPSSALPRVLGYK